MTFDAIYLTQQDLATRWQISGRTLERWRAEQNGPAWYEIVGSVRYRLADVEDFEERHRHGMEESASVPAEGEME